MFPLCDFGAYVTWERTMNGSSRRCMLRSLVDLRFMPITIKTATRDHLKQILSQHV